MGKLNPFKTPKMPAPPVIAAAPPPPPPAAPPAVAPVEDDEQIRKARKKSMAAQLSRSGRESTLLTDSTGKLGG